MNNNTIYLAVTVAFMIGLAIIGIMISRGVKSIRGLDGSW